MLKNGSPVFIRNWTYSTFVALAFAGPASGEIVKGSSSTRLLGGIATTVTGESSFVHSRRNDSKTAAGAAQVHDDDADLMIADDASFVSKTEVHATGNERRPATAFNAEPPTLPMNRFAGEPFPQDVAEGVENAFDRNVWKLNAALDPEQISITADAFNGNANSSVTDVWPNLLEPRGFSNPKFSFSASELLPPSSEIVVTPATVSEGYAGALRRPRVTDYRVDELALAPEITRFDLSGARGPESPSKDHTNSNPVADVIVSNEPIPEPSSLWFLSVASASVTFVLHRSRRKSASARSADGVR